MLHAGAMNVRNTVYVLYVQTFDRPLCCLSPLVRPGTSVQEIQTSHENIAKINSAGESEFTFLNNSSFKGPSQCYYMSLSFVNIDNIGCINFKHFSQSSFICETLCSFTFCVYSINVTESTRKCVTIDVN